METDTCDLTSPTTCTLALPAQTVPPSPPPQTDPVTETGPASPLHKDMPSLPPVINDRDEFLVHLANILKRIHEVFYTWYDSLHPSDPSFDIIVTPDLKEIIPQLRHSVLGGTRLAFTGVIPTDMPLEKSREWNTARAFGATVHEKLVSGLESSDPEVSGVATTHLVVGRAGTTKHKQALRMQGIKLVNPLWLWSCAERWKMVNEAHFPFALQANEEKPEKDANGGGKEGENKKEEKWKQPSQAPLSSREGKKQARGVGAATDSRSALQFSMLGLVGRSSVNGSNSAERRFSVSSEELERMEAEINAELSDDDDNTREINSDSESSESDESTLGSVMEQVQEQSVSTESFDAYLGVSEPSIAMQSGAKKRQRDAEDSSDSSNSFDLSQSQSLEKSDDDEDESDSGDELAKLLGM